MSRKNDSLKELRSLNEKQLQQHLSELREKMRKLLFQTKSDEIRNVHEYRETRKDIARTLTILNEKRRISRK